MSSYSIAAKTRTDKSPDKIRQEDRIPAVVYGPDIESSSISVDALNFRELYRQAGVSNLIDLEVENEDGSLIVLVQDLQYDPVKDSVLHIDFKQIPMGEEIEAAIRLEYVGVSPAVKAQGGVLLKELEELEVSCLPEDLVDHIEIDISQLEEIDDTIFVRDLELPDGIDSLHDPDNLVAKVSEVTVEEFEEEEEGEEEEMTIEDVEVEGEEEEELEEEEEDEQEESQE